MFERYTERARRVIFFARYEASQFGSTAIESEHVLLGLVQEDRNIIDRFLNIIDRSFTRPYRVKAFARKSQRVSQSVKRCRHRSIYLFPTSASASWHMRPKRLSV